MSQITVYICDICKNSKSKDDLEMDVKVEGLLIKGVNKYNPLKIDICKDCLKKKGFVIELQKSDEEKHKTSRRNPLTVQEKIYDILEDMGVAFIE